MCGLILVLAWFVVPRDPPRMPGAEADRRIDWVGGALVTAAICLFTFSLTESGIAKRGWASPRTYHAFTSVHLLYMRLLIAP